MKGKEMRQLRRDLELTQREVAKALGTSGWQICRWEVNDQEIPRKYAERFQLLIENAGNVLAPHLAPEIVQRVEIPAPAIMSPGQRQWEALLSLYDAACRQVAVAIETAEHLAVYIEKSQPMTDEITELVNTLESFRDQIGGAMNAAKVLFDRLTGAGSQEKE
jgi:DNA-binding XRE family transcriptional regulator/HAMP domain-containing protein